MKQDMIVILDLGSTENTVVAREIRELGVYSEIHPHDITVEELQALDNVKGIILNGGENRVVDGKEVEKTLLNEDVYYASKAVYRVGPAAVSAPVPPIGQPVVPETPAPSEPAPTNPEPTQPQETHPDAYGPGIGLETQPAAPAETPAPQPAETPAPAPAPEVAAEGAAV